MSPLLLLTSRSVFNLTVRGTECPTATSCSDLPSFVSVPSVHSTVLDNCMIMQDTLHNYEAPKTCLTDCFSAVSVSQCASSSNFPVHSGSIACSELTCPTIYLVNATSLVKPAATELLAQDLVVNNVTVGIICETWFRNFMLDTHLSVENYVLYRKDRLSRKGGGVCMYVSSQVFSKQLQLPSDSNANFELLAVLCSLGSAEFIIVACYHPPKPIYTADCLISAIRDDFEHLYSLYPTGNFFFAGDLNKLSCDFLTTELGLIYLSTSATHGNNILDKIFTNSFNYKAVTIRSLLKTKHLAILAHATDSNFHPTGSSKKVVVYDLRQQYIDRLRAAIASFDFVSLIGNNLVSNYSDVIVHLQSFILQHIPTRTVTMRPRDPPFVTPLIKLLLKQRCKARKAGHTRHADDLATKINALMYAASRNRYTHLSSANCKQLWHEVNGAHRNSSGSTLLTTTDPAMFNAYFAGISYSACEPIDFNVSSFVSSVNSPIFTPVDEREVEKMFRDIHNTAPGLDCLPAWFFRSCSIELSSLITTLFNQSLSSGVLPAAWCTAIVTPVPKIPKPCAIGDFRPISVTPILSRLAESIVVKNYLRPALLSGNLADQFAFRPTGSTSCALIYLFDKVTHHLERTGYVRCLLIDFSKAFDIVDRSLLMLKLENLSLPLEIKAWIASFLSNRTQATKINSLTSSFLPTNLGVVQGSVLGPSLFSLMVSDLHTVCGCNDLCKYADDLTLIVPEDSDVGLEVEYSAIKEWAALNKLTINSAKTKEIVFHRPRPSKSILPPTLSGIERVTVAKLLGIHVNDTYEFL